MKWDLLSASDLEAMKSHLKDSNMPEFADVGGMLSDKMKVDEDDEGTALKAIIQAVLLNVRLPFPFIFSLGKTC